VTRRLCVIRNLEHEEAKARYRVVKNTTTMGCNARKTNKQTEVKNEHSYTSLFPIRRHGKDRVYGTIRTSCIIFL
jgi:hypothetical protein